MLWFRGVERSLHRRKAPLRRAASPPPPPAPVFQWTVGAEPAVVTGCTPSKSAVIYSQDRVCRDLDTCSTFVPSLKRSAATPEGPGPCVDPGIGRQPFLSVPRRDVHGRSVSQSSALSVDQCGGTHSDLPAASGLHTGT
ncbi:hypothetical protein Q5P01_013796 [Channa striata]|uniref:Uncharacterized protein n=1 Tax=Channa striata TaxID=64152 RepID=A0AA88MKV3_CHASR|nr:hypothetical protein Q5P01_013796 [Channa striata]